MMKFFQKMSKDAFKVQFFAFLWIFICNVIVQVLIHCCHLTDATGNWTWTIFLANVLFFIKSNPNNKEGLLENACGGIFGLLGAMGLIELVTLFAKNGWSTLLATLIAIFVFLFLTIAIHPMVPYVFNNMSLCFFLVALINGTAEVLYEAGQEGLSIEWWSDALGKLGTQTVLMAHPWLHFLGVILGNVIVNIGTVLVVTLVLKRNAKKAAAKK